MPADALTKAMPVAKFATMMNLLNFYVMMMAALHKEVIGVLDSGCWVVILGWEGLKALARLGFRAWFWGVQENMPDAPDSPALSEGADQVRGQVGPSKQEKHRKRHGCTRPGRDHASNRRHHGDCLLRAVPVDRTRAEGCAEDQGILRASMTLTSNPCQIAKALEFGQRCPSFNLSSHCLASE